MQLNETQNTGIQNVSGEKSSKLNLSVYKATDRLEKLKGETIKLLVFPGSHFAFR